MSATHMDMFELCPECGGYGDSHALMGGCSTCLGDSVVMTKLHLAAVEAGRASGMSPEDAAEILRKAAAVESAPSQGYGNTIKRDGAAFATVASWPDALAVAQSMSTVYKRARFEASGALGQAKTYRAGRVIS